MKIPQALPQFDTAKTLLIVTGAQEAVVYDAYKGEITERSEFRIEKPTFSDKEGFFQESGQGKTYRSGAIEQDIKGEIQNKFFASFRETLKQIANENKIDQIYLFAPNYLAHDIRKIVEKYFADIRIEQFAGNYTKHSPIELISIAHKEHKEKIDTEKEGMVKEEAKKILDRFKKIIGR